LRRFALAEHPVIRHPRVDPRTSLRLLLLRLGARISGRLVHDLSCALAALSLGHWLAQQTPSRLVPRRPHRIDMFRDALSLVAGNAPLYLEFGVWDGASLQWWTEHLRGPAARFVGFDSFDGLPEPWRPDYPRGTFDRNGTPPPCTDPRVTFEIGRFDDTLARFCLPPHDQLVINIDCTLYASTATVLRWVEPHLRTGDLIIFDELPEYDHELRAFREHTRRIDLQLIPVSHARGYHWLFRYASKEQAGA
jgi:hypothetical protein